MTSRQELQVQQKRELETKEETTVPASSLSDLTPRGRLR